MGGAQSPLDRLLHAEHDAVIDRQGNADPLALPAGTVVLVLSRPGGGLIGLFSVLSFRGGHRKMPKTSDGRQQDQSEQARAALRARTRREGKSHKNPSSPL